MPKPILLEVMKSRAGIPTNDLFAMLWAQKLRAGSSSVQTLTGQPPLSFKADGTPFISWSMKGNGSQTGTPSPVNPVMPTFCGVRTGNLYFKKIAGANISDSGVITTLAGFDLYVAKVEQGVRYSGNGYIYAFFEDEPVIGSISFNGSRVVESPNNIVSPINGFVAARVSNTVQNVMCNTGSSILPYEPYGWKIPITCAGQTVPVYLGEVPTVRRVKKLALTGEETNWTQQSVANEKIRFRLPVSDAVPADTAHATSVCTHLVLGAEGSTWNTDLVYVIASSYLYLRIDAYQTLTSFKSFLQQQYQAGTPVTVWYVLANEQTGIVNEPLCKIGTYVDELHSEDAGVNIPTVKGANTLTVETELQPSEMTIVYKS